MWQSQRDLCPLDRRQDHGPSSLESPPEAPRASSPPESQCGFRTGRETTDMVFAARQIQEKSMEKHQDLFFTFVVLMKAFDTVSREGLWIIMSKFGCPDRLLKFVRLFHNRMMARMLDDGNASDPFQVISGGKQAAPLSPRCSVWCSWRCWQMPSEKPPLAFPSITGVMGNCSTSGVYRPSPKSRRLWSEISSLLTTVPSIPMTSKRCNKGWTHSPLPVTTSVSPSAPKRLKWCISPPQESHTRNQTSQ